MKISRIAVAAATLLAAVSAFALSDQYVQFGKGPAQWIMTKDEAAQWKKVNTDAEAQAFIDLFWAKRDTTPGTPDNEYKDLFDARVKYADEHFAHGRTRGAMTDRGRVLIVLGSPSRIQRTGSEPQGTIQTPDRPTGTTMPSADAQPNTIQGYSPKQLWFYDQSKIKVPLNAPTVEVAFIDQYGSDDWKLERTPRTDYISLLENVNRFALAQPDLKSVPVPAVAAAPTPAPAVAVPAMAPVPAAPSIGSFKTDALKAATEEALAGKGAYKNLYLTYGEYVTPAGDYFVPVQLYVPKAAGLTADNNLTFYGEVVDEQGQPVAVYEEPAKLTASKDDFFFARTLDLKPGKYKATFGLAQDGKPLSMVSTDLGLTPLDKSAESVSQLILSNNLYPLPAAQKPTDPYSFGGLKVVPKSDRTFHTADEIFYFIEVRNPGLDPAANAPKLQTKISLSGKNAEGKPVKMENPLTEAEATPLNGVPGHFFVGSSIPANVLKPGDYTLKIRLLDTVSKQSYDVEQPFKIVS